MRIILFLLLSSSVVFADRASFEHRWSGRHVRLSQALYSIVVERKVYGVTTSTPDRGVFYSAYFEAGHDLAARDPQDLLAKAQGLWGRRTEPRLVTYAAGTPMVVLRVEIAPVFHRNEIWVQLADAIQPAERATTIKVVLPHDIDRDFSAEADVDKLVTPFFAP